jgi:hypothetical protein
MKKLDEKEIRSICDGEHPDYSLVTEDEVWNGWGEKIKIFKCHSDEKYWKMILWMDGNDVIRRDRKLIQVVEKIITVKVWAEENE